MGNNTMDPAKRKTQLLEVGAKLASKHGTLNVTRRMVALAAKVSEALVAHYMGSTKDAQQKYARKARDMKLPLPDKEKSAQLGAKLRAHGPRPERKRSIREVKAIKRNIAAKKIVVKPKSKPLAEHNKKFANAGKAAAKRERVAAEKPAPKSNKALPGPSANKSAARAPKLPPLLPPPLPPIA
jgi:hypothetical protein